MQALISLFPAEWRRRKPIRRWVPRNQSDRIGAEITFSPRPFLFPCLECTVSCMMLQYIFLAYCSEAPVLTLLDRQILLQEVFFLSVPTYVHKEQ